MGVACEICGGAIIKENGGFQCVSCGCKYTLTEVKKLNISANAAESETSTGASAEDTAREAAEAAAREAEEKAAREAEAAAKAAEEAAARAAEEAAARAAEEAAARAAEEAAVRAAEEAARAAEEAAAREAAEAAKASAAQLAEYREVAIKARKDGNIVKADEFAGKVLEKDQTCYEAWMIKGIAAGNESTADNIQFEKCVEYWNNAYSNAPIDKKQDVISDISNEMGALIKDLIKKISDAFIADPSVANKEAFVASDSLLAQADSLISIGVTVDENDIRGYINALMYDSAVEGAESSNAKFGTDESKMNTDNWEIWMREQDNCIELLEEFSKSVTEKDMINDVFGRLNDMQDAILKSCSYKFASLHGTFVKDMSINDIDKDERINKKIEYKKRYDRKMLELSREKQKEAAEEAKEKEAKIADYWAAHKDEKAKIDEEIAIIQAELDSIKIDEVVKANHIEIEKLRKKADKKVPAEDEKEKIKQSIWNIEKEINNLGFMKGKQKKVLQDTLDEKKQELEAVEAKIAEQKREIQAGIDAQILEIKAKERPLQERAVELSKRKKELQSELNRERERSIYLVG